MHLDGASAMAFYKNKILSFAFLLGAIFVLASCANSQDQSVMDGSAEISDPFESTNRAIFKFNNAVDDNVLHPVLKGYRYVTPKEARNGLNNFLTNLKSPVLFANQVLQGDVDGAGNVLFRATVNTLIGVGGLFDVAGGEGYKHEPEDFGQTLAVWGLDHGPYLVVPIIGPSSARDYIGYIVDGFADPLRWYLFNINEEEIYYAKVAVDYLTLREQLMDVLEELESSSIDYYAATRSIYYQRREALVNDEGSDGSNMFAIPDYDE